MLSNAVNSYLDKILKVVKEYNGDVVKFAGDAIIVVWVYTDDLPRATLAAALCALRLQEHCGSHLIEKTDLEFKIHIGMVCGVIETEVCAQA